MGWLIACDYKLRERGKKRVEHISGVNVKLWIVYFYMSNYYYCESTNAFNMRIEEKKEEKRKKRK